MTQGIYLFINKSNNKKYVGQSINIEKRERDHFYEHTNKSEKNKAYDFKINQAFRKYGYKNFDFLILEIVPDTKTIDEREIFWIEYYDSFKNGYNGTPDGGGAGRTGNNHEKNGRALLKLNDVIDIRTRYNNLEPFRNVYEDYKSIISKRGFQKIWYFETWKDVMPEALTKENKKFHNTKSKSLDGSSIHNALFTKEEVILYRARKSMGESTVDIFKDVKKGTYRTFINMINKKTYKDVN